jgi:hypothetical protein
VRRAGGWTWPNSVFFFFGGESYLVGLDDAFVVRRLSTKIRWNLNCGGEKKKMRRRGRKERKTINRFFPVFVSVSVFSGSYR